MARLHRPHIPLAVRVQVAERQILQLRGQPLLDKLRASAEGCSLRMRLMVLLGALMTLLGSSELRLDHDPALCNRPQHRKGLGRKTYYIPDANDPEHLIYRTRADHDIKTRIRGEKGQFSDLALLRREKRRRKKSTKRKHKMTSRPFPKIKRGFR